MCSDQYGCFLYFLNFLLSGYVAQTLSEWYWNGSSRPCYYRYHFCFHIPHVLNFCYKLFTYTIFSASFLNTFLSLGIATSIHILLLLLLLLLLYVLSYFGKKGHGSKYEGWNFNSGNYLFTTDTKYIHVSKFYCPSM